MENMTITQLGELAAGQPEWDCQLSRFFHKHGVNMRYLGLVRAIVPKRAQYKPLRFRLLVTMLSRTFKVRLNRCLRAVVSNSPQMHNLVILRLLRLLLGDCKAAPAALVPRFVPGRTQEIFIEARPAGSGGAT